MRTLRPVQHLMRWGAVVGAAGLLSLGGVWVSAQDASPLGAPDRERVPSLSELDAQLVRLRRDNDASVGGPALEHAALALARARAATSPEEAQSPARSADGLRARRIAYAALTLVVAQRERERARILRDDAAEARRDADGAARTAEEALRVARANAAAATRPASTPAPSSGTEGASPAAAATDPVPSGDETEGAP